MSKRYACANHLKKIYNKLDEAADYIKFNEREIEDWEACFYIHKEFYEIERCLTNVVQAASYLDKARGAAFWLEIELMEDE